MRVRKATKQDIDAFTDLPKPTMLAWVGEIDGRPVALGGLALVDGVWIAFCDLEEEARPFTITIARASIRIFEEAKRMGIKYIYAEAEESEPTALRWLSYLGFKPDSRNPRFYRWCG